jgi:hypothetical protein
MHIEVESKRNAILARNQSARHEDEWGSGADVYVQALLT